MFSCQNEIFRGPKIYNKTVYGDILLAEFSDVVHQWSPYSKQTKGKWSKTKNGKQKTGNVVASTATKLFGESCNQSEEPGNDYKPSSEFMFVVFDRVMCGHFF